MSQDMMQKAAQRETGDQRHEPQHQYRNVKMRKVMITEEELKMKGQ